MTYNLTRMRGAIAVVMLTLAQPARLRAQQQSTDNASDSISASVPYRSPQLELAEPANGAGLSQDKPSVVFRYAQGEPDDPLDLVSFAVVVDGEDRSARFHADSAEAWGSIDPLSSGASAGQALALGVHQLAARVCSSRGICADVRATVTVVPSVLTTVGPPTTTHKSRLLTAIALLLALIEKLFTL